MATIELNARHNPLAWLLYFTKLRVAVDGQPSTSAWGRQKLSVTPGTHLVEISFGYIFAQRGQAATTLTATDDQPARLGYMVPSWMFAKGRITSA